MSIMDQRPFRVMRRTTWLVAGRLVSDVVPLDVDRCPVYPGFVRVMLTGPDLTGTITIDGLRGGAPVSETLTASGPIAGQGWQGVTCEAFDCVTGITTAGLSDEAEVPIIEVAFVSPGGAPIPINCEIADCVLGYLEHPGRQTWPNAIGGTHESSRPWIAHRDVYDFEPRRGDFYVEQRGDPLVDYRVWEVHGNPEHLGTFDSRHWELDVQEANAADLAISTL